MKLTPSQIKGMRAVAEGLVQENESLWISRPSHISGFRADVIHRLEAKGLVSKQRVSKLASLYVLTDSGMEVFHHMDAEPIGLRN